MNFESLLRSNPRAELAKRNLRNFIVYTKPDYHFNWHHLAIAEKLDQFAKGKIKKLMLFVPPQHGKSELATRRLPAYILGVRPKTKIAICSYSDTLSTAFNRDIQRIIDDKPYHEIFPETFLNSSNVVSSSQNDFLRNANIFETVGHRGFVKTVGVMGSLTGTPVDVGIIDDPFKDREEAMSNTIRERVYNWYTDVFATRLSNDSQQLLIMTRWHQDDLAGRILVTDDDWEVIIFQAIKEKNYPNDPRAPGEALWPEKHSLERLIKIKTDTPITFNSLYQQEPKASKDILVFPEWEEIEEMPHYPQQFGIDFGFPTAIIEVMWHNKNLYLNEIEYDVTNPTNQDILVKLHAKKINLSRPFICDSSEPRSIKDLNQGADIDGEKIRMNASQAIKGKDSISFGISKMKECKIFVTKWSHNIKRELNNYSWMTHNGKITDQPIDDYNHAIDATRYVYVTLGIRKITQSYPITLNNHVERETERLAR